MEVAVEGISVNTFRPCVIQIYIKISMQTVGEFAEAIEAMHWLASE
jgi:hypothetical protein